MKIVIFTYFFPKISETFILNRITRLIDNGFDVRIFALKNPSVVKAYEDDSLETIVHPDVIKYKLSEKVEYFPRKPSGELDTSLIDQRINVYNPDLIHIQWGNLGEELLSNLDFLAPVIVSFHSSVTPRTWSISNTGFSSVFKKANTILPVSDYIKNELTSMGCDSRKLITHHMGVDTSLFFPGLTKNNNTVDILSVGSFIEKKGFQDAIRAIGILPKDLRASLKYKLIGEGPMKTEYERLIRKGGIKDIVIFLGKLTQDRVVLEYQNSDIYIHSSMLSSEGDDEGIPTAIIEAQSCSIPIISTRHTGIPEVVQHGVSGYLSAENDINDLSTNLSRLVSNQNLREKMGKSGRKIVVDKFNVDTLTQNMITIYKNIQSNGNNS